MVRVPVNKQFNYNEQRLVLSLFSSPLLSSLLSPRFLSVLVLHEKNIWFCLLLGFYPLI